jgi:hypothetical protein
MEIIKRKILINDLGENIYFKINISQSIDNMGLMTDMPFDGSCITQCTIGSDPLIFMNEGISSVWYKQGGKVVYGSDSKLNQLKSYDKNEVYKLNFNIKSESYGDFQSPSVRNINGVDKVTKIDGDNIIYVLNAKRDLTIGTSQQSTGMLYEDNPETPLDLPKELDNEITTTRVEYTGEGWNETNTSLEPQIQEDYLLGIISEPEVETDVFIDRSTFSVLDKHLRLSEIESLDHLTRYGNGFYNINRN